MRKKIFLHREAKKGGSVKFGASKIEVGYAQQLKKELAVETLALKKIRFIQSSAMQPASELAIAWRLVEYLYSKKREHLILEMLNGSRVLKNSGKFYAYENYTLLICMSRLIPDIEVDFNVEQVRDKNKLYSKFVARNLVESILNIDIKTVLEMQENLNIEFGLKSLIPMSELSRIVGRHRSTMYKRNKVKYVEDELVVDLNVALSNIPDRSDS